MLCVLQPSMVDYIIGLFQPISLYSDPFPWNFVVTPPTGEEYILPCHRFVLVSRIKQGSQRALCRASKDLHVSIFTHASLPFPEQLGLACLSLDEKDMKQSFPVSAFTWPLVSPCVSGSSLLLVRRSVIGFKAYSKSSEIPF